MRGELQESQVSVREGEKKASEDIKTYKEQNMEKTRAETDLKLTVKLSAMKSEDFFFFNFRRTSIKKSNRSR